jgi:hypothetical protein
MSTGQRQADGIRMRQAAVGVGAAHEEVCGVNAFLLFTN